ncbi:MAG: hypothetical protein KDJ29_15285 [Hyphomicrobiales bacterium]|nr:hypothetical protein [Hyphomicrobiales bacterium]
MLIVIRPKYRAIMAAMALMAAYTFAGRSHAQGFLEDARKAAVSYADEKAKQAVKEQSRAAILALYKKLYKSGADKRLVRVLGAAALSADEINALAEKAADAAFSGNPDSVKAVHAQVTLALGRTLTAGLKDPALRGQMASLLGSSAKVNEIASVLGQAAGGDPKAAFEFAGRALINATPAAAVFTAAETAVGVMKYAHGKFVDSQIDDLYRKYRDGDELTREAIREQLETGRIYTNIVMQQRRDLADARAAEIANATAQPGDQVRKQLTEASEREVVESILNTFAARERQEQLRAEKEQAHARALSEAQIMSDALNSVASNKHGRNWTATRSYNLELFMKRVKDRLQNDGVLDPSNPNDLRSVANLMSVAIVHGTNSDAYKAVRKDFEDMRNIRQGTAFGASPAGQKAQSPQKVQPGKCQPGSASRKEADRLWAIAARGARSKNYRILRTAVLAAKKSVATCPDSARSAAISRIGRAYALALSTSIANRVQASMPNTRVNLPLVNQR